VPVALGDVVDAARLDATDLVRGFGPPVFTLLRTSPNAAVHKAAGVGEPVTQDIAISVKGDRVECSINGTAVAGYDKSAYGSTYPGEMIFVARKTGLSR